MLKQTRRRPARGGEREGVPDAQGRLTLKGGGSRRPLLLHIVSRSGEDVLRYSVAVGPTRISGPTPYRDRARAVAYATGVSAVAQAVHDRLGADAVARVLSGPYAVVRWRKARGMDGAVPRSGTRMPADRHPPSADGATGIEPEVPEPASAVPD